MSVCVCGGKERIETAIRRLYTCVCVGGREGKLWPVLGYVCVCVYGLRLVREGGGVKCVNVCVVYRWQGEAGVRCVYMWEGEGVEAGDS